MHLKNIFLAGSLGAFAIMTVPQAAWAENAPKVEIAQQETPQILTEVYGQTLDLTDIHISDEDYTWNQLKALLPKVLPDAATLEKSAEVLCDDLGHQYTRFSIDTERLIAVVTSEMVRARSPLILDAETKEVVELPEDIVSGILLSKDMKDVQALSDALPDHKSEVKLARDRMLGVVLLTYLHDAAILNCSDYAQKKGYELLTSEDPVYDSKNDPLWEKFEAQFK